VQLYNKAIAGNSRAFNVLTKYRAFAVGATLRVVRDNSLGPGLSSNSRTV